MSKQISHFSREKISQSSKCYSNKSFKTREDSGVFCHHCKSSKEDLQIQITQLKDKAHQSFMQVLQIQQLHDEELTLLREQFDQKESQYQLEIEKLRNQNEILKNQMFLIQKNTRRHSCDFGSNEFAFGNIDAILCEEGQASYLDESQLMQFKDFITIRSQNDYVANLRKEIFKDTKLSNNNKAQIQKLFIMFKELKEQNFTLVQKNEDINRKLSIAQNQLKSSRHTSDSLNNEIKFMSEQIKRLGNDKLKLQKKISEIQRSQGGVESNLNGSRPKIDTHLNRITRSNIKSLSPNFRLEALEREKNMSNICFPKQKQQSVEKKQVNELSYAKFMCSDSIQINPDLKKRNSDHAKKSIKT